MAPILGFVINLTLEANPFGYSAITTSIKTRREFAMVSNGEKRNPIPFQIAKWTESTPIIHRLRSEGCAGLRHGLGKLSGYG